MRFSQEDIEKDTEQVCPVKFTFSSKEHPTLTEIALKREGYEDSHEVCSLDDIKKSLAKYIILHDYNYLTGGFYENSTILAVDGNFALLVHNSYLTEDDKVGKSK